MNETPLQITVRQQPDAVVIQVIGDVTASGSGQVEDAVEPHVTSPGTPVVIDLSQTTFMSSTGLATLVQLNSRARRSGRELRLRNPSAHLARMLAIANLFADQS